MSKIPDLPSNSNTNKNKPKMSPIINKGSLVSTKKNLGERILNAWFDLDEESTILGDIVIPAIKNCILESLNMMFFHGDGKSTYNRKDGYYRVSYDQKYKGRDYNYKKSESDRSYRGDDKVDPRNIVVRERTEAERIVDKLKERISEYHSASVADLLELVDLPSNYVDNNWGWSDERRIGLRRVNKGWLIDVDEPKYIE